MPSILIPAETAIQATRSAQQARAGCSGPKGEEQRLQAILAAGQWAMDHVVAGGQVALTLDEVALIEGHLPA